MWNRQDPEKRTNSPPSGKFTYWLLLLLSHFSRVRLYDPIDGSPPGSPVPGILQARTLEWLAISFSNAWKGRGEGKSLSHVWLVATPWTASHQAPPSMGFSRQEDWSGVPLPSPYILASWPLLHLIKGLNKRIFKLDKLWHSFCCYGHVRVK